MSPKLSKSYLKFEKVIKRALNLVDMQKLFEKRLPGVAKEGHFDFGDLSRSAVVLSVAAMDAYFTDVFMERFTPYLKKRGPTKGIIELLDNAGFNTKFAIEILPMERPLRRIRCLLDQHLENHTTQATDAIDTLFLAYGFKNFSTNVQKLKKRKTLLRSIEILVNRRHEIAHEGDMNSRHKLNPIDSKEIKRRIMDIVTFVNGAEGLLRKQRI